MKAGISTCYFNKIMLTEDDFAMCAATGVHNIELLIGQDHLPQYPDLCKKYNIAFSHRHTWMKDISARQDHLRKTYTEMIIDDVKNFATYAADGSEKIVVIHASGQFEEKDRAEHYEYSLANLRTIAKAADELGITIAVENALMPHCLGDSPEELLRIIDDVGTDNVGACLDVGHANVTRSIDKHFEVLGNKLITFHLHDNIGKPDWLPWPKVDRHDIPGTGDIDWAKLGQNIKSIGYDGTLIFEVGFFRHEGRPHEGLVKIKEYFDTYLA